MNPRALFVVVFVGLAPLVQAWGNITNDFMATELCRINGCDNCSFDFLISAQAEYGKTGDVLVLANKYLNQSYAENRTCPKWGMAGRAFYYYTVLQSPTRILPNKDFDNAVDRWVGQNRTRWQVEAGGAKANQTTLQDIILNFIRIFEQKQNVILEEPIKGQKTRVQSYEGSRNGLNEQKGSESEAILWFSESQPWFYNWQNLLLLQIGLILVWFWIWHKFVGGSKAAEHAIFGSEGSKRTTVVGNVFRGWGWTVKATFLSVLVCDLIVVIVFFVLPVVF